MKRKEEREQFFYEESERLLLGDASPTEWSVFISESVCLAFINGADLATIIMVGVCIEAYLRSEIKRKAKVC